MTIGLVSNWIQNVPVAVFFSWSFPVMTGVPISGAVVVSTNFFVTSTGDLAFFRNSFHTSFCSFDREFSFCP